MSSYKSDNISLQQLEKVAGGDSERGESTLSESFEPRDRTGTANESDITDNSLEAALLAKEYGHEGFEHSANSRQSLSNQAVRKLSTITTPFSWRLSRMHRGQYSFYSIAGS